MNETRRETSTQSQTEGPPGRVTIQLDGRPHAVHDRTQIARLLVQRALELIDRSHHGAATRVTEHDDEPRMELRRRELHAADLRGRNHVAGHADHEQVAEPLIENDLGRHARVGATQDDRERLLALRELVAPRGAHARIALPIGNETPIAFAQQGKRLAS